VKSVSRGSVAGYRRASYARNSPRRLTRTTGATRRYGAGGELESPTRGYLTAELPNKRASQTVIGDRPVDAK
jgi:hypothetical protein